MINHICSSLINHGFFFSLCSALFSAGVTAIGLLTALRMIGFNLEPIMAIGGVSTIFIGFGSQILTANAVSGVDLVRCENRSKVRVRVRDGVRGWVESQAGVECNEGRSRTSSSA